MDEAAKAILADAGWQRGVCVCLDSNGGELAVALARHAELSVYRIDDAAAAVQRTRGLAESANLSPLQIRVEQGPLEKLAYPDYCANLIVADAFTDELLRILRPAGGVAYVRSERGLPESGFRVGKLAGGLVRLERMPLTGAGAWTHFQHDATNNRYSADQRIQPPFGVLWYGEPVTHRGGFWFGQGLAADGLLFLTDLSPNNPRRCWLTARDAYNGAVHWQREVGGDRFLWREPLRTDARSFTSQINSPGKIQPEQIAIAEGKIYVADKERCLVIDAGTGKDLASFTAPAPSAAKNEWAYLAHADGHLYGYTAAPYDLPQNIRRGVPSRRRDNPPTLFALDPTNGESRWVRGGQGDEEFGGELQSPLAIGAGRVMVRCGDTLYGLDARTGKTLWSDERVDSDSHTWWEGVLHEDRLYLLRYDKRFYNRRLGAATLIFRAADGKRLGEESVAQSKYKGGPPSIVAGLNYTPSGSNGCNLATAAGNVLFGRNGYSIFDPDRKSWGAGDYDGARASCRVGAVPAAGLVHLLPNFGCTCRPFNATLTLSHQPSVESVDTGAAPEPEFHAELPAARQLSAQADDWPTFRRHPSRDAVTPQNLAPPMEQAWQTKLAGQLTAPIAVGDMVFLGSSDERIYALDASSGAVRWTYYAAGPVHAAPVYWQGRIYFGAEDGWIYCLSADAGELLWRLQAAPHDRRQGAFDRIVSAWPVQQGLAVADGRLFFTAGRVPGQGAISGALDADNGRLLWRETGVRGVPSWHVVLGADRAFVPMEDRGNKLAQLDLETGQRLDVDCILASAAGISFIAAGEQDAAEFADGFLVHGGGGVDRFGGRSKGNAYGLTAPWKSSSPVKGEDFSSEVRAFFPIVGQSRMYFGRHGELVAVARQQLPQLLKTRESLNVDSGRRSLLQWRASELPSGEPDWAILAGDDRRDDATLLVGGREGIAAVAAATGQVRWSLKRTEATNSPAVAGGRVYLTTASGQVICLKSS